MFNIFIAVQVNEGTVPPTSTVRKFLALLEQSDMDFSEELGKQIIILYVHKKPYPFWHSVIHKPFTKKCITVLPVCFH